MMSTFLRYQNPQIYILLKKKLLNLQENDFSVLAAVRIWIELLINWASVLLFFFVSIPKSLTKSNPDEEAEFFSCFLPNFMLFFMVLLFKAFQHSCNTLSEACLCNALQNIMNICNTLKHLINTLLMHYMWFVLGLGLGLTLLITD